MDEELAQRLQELETLAKAYMNRDALSRYGNIKLAYPERAAQSLMVIADIVKQQRATIIDDKAYKDILQKITPQKTEFKINRI